MAINSVIITGRLTKEPELRKTTTGKSFIRFTLGVDRMKKGETDFINCTAWNQSADFLSSYAHKGDLIGITGRLQVTNSDRNGQTQIFTDVVADHVEILSKKQTQSEPRYEAEEAPLPEQDLDDLLPF